MVAVRKLEGNDHYSNFDAFYLSIVILLIQLTVFTNTEGKKAMRRRSSSLVYKMDIVNMSYDKLHQAYRFCICWHAIN